MSLQLIPPRFRSLGASWALAAVLLALPSASMPARAQGARAAELPSQLKAKVRASCFEVVIAKPAETGVSYEKDLPWDSVPFAERNDKYYSIGTAFAVSPTELLTAFHVLALGDDSMAFRQYYIRDAQGQVSELDKIVAADEHRDAVRFTVKGRTFPQWFELRPGVQEGADVFTVGNALGDGIVIRRGDMLGTTPEPMEGAWKLIKSSAEVNPGNSGGPLVDGQGRAVGIVLRKNDNLCYSLPASEILAMKAGAAVFHNRLNYGFRLFPEQLTGVLRAFEVQLPLPYADAKHAVHARMQEVYKANMGRLFADNEKEMFPSGASSQEAIVDIPSSDVPQVIFKDETTRKWSLSDLKYSSNDLGGNGLLAYAVATDILFADLTRPSDVKLKDLYANPRLMMDLFLKGLNIPREMGGQKIRITSLGDPVSRQRVTDKLGRVWNLDLWQIPYSDEVAIVYSTAVPCGVDMIVKVTNSPQLDEWKYDMAKVVDLTYIPYYGKLRDWPEFLQEKDRLPAQIRDAEIRYEPGKSLAFRTPWFDADLEKHELPLNPTEFLALDMGFTPATSGGVKWDLRRIAMGGGKEDGYFVVLRHISPFKGMSEGFEKNWEDVAKGKHPYTGTPFQNEGRTDIATTLFSAPSEIYTLYEGRSGAVPEADMKRGLAALQRALSIHTTPAVKGVSH